MRRIMIWSLVFGIVLLALGIVNAQSVPACPDASPTRLIVGQQGTVIRTTDHPLHTEPDTVSDEVPLPPDSVFFIHAGPICAEGFAWWYIEYEGAFGWAAEGEDEAYYLEPIGDSLLDIATRTPAPSDVLTFTNEAEDIRVSFGQDIAAEVAEEIVPEATEGEPHEIAPEHTLITFENYPVESDHPAELRIYPASAFEQITGESLRGLNSLLTVRPEQPRVVNSPLIDSVLIFVSRPTYVDFGNGSGVRYIAHWADSLSPVIGGNLYYVFTGLTTDREYYVQAIFPLSSDLLPKADLLDNPDFNEATFIENYGGYIESVEDMLTNAPRVSFVPSLGELDELMGSLQIGELVEVVTEATTAPDSEVVENATPSPTSVTSGPCMLVAFADTNLRVSPDIDAVVPGFIPGEVAVAADGQFRQIGESFAWWRLVAEAPVTLYPGYPRNNYWVRADFVREEGDCGALSLIPR